MWSSLIVTVQHSCGSLNTFADEVHTVERLFRKQDVGGSSPLIGSTVTASAPKTIHKFGASRREKPTTSGLA